MKRWLARILTTLSLLLCIATIGSWVRSYWVGDSLIWSDGADRPQRVYRMGHRYVLTLAQGRIYVMHDTSWWFPPQFRYLRSDNPAWANPPFVPFKGVLGFRWAAFVGTPMAANVPVPPFLMYRIIGVPHWFLAAAAAVFPFAHLIRALRVRRRRRLGLCLHCGYDLRASKDRCPECGLAIASSAAAGTA